jgi:hypothetical protein
MDNYIVCTTTLVKNLYKCRCKKTVTPPSAKFFNDTSLELKLMCRVRRVGVDMVKWRGVKVTMTWRHVESSWCWWC